jgi:hypothetical protein
MLIAIRITETWLHVNAITITSPLNKSSITVRAGPIHMGAPGMLIIWRPLKPIFFKPFSA